MRAKVAALRTEPCRVLDDIHRLMELADFKEYLAPGRTTILKTNISWHFPFPGANTTPWQLEGVIRTLLEAGYDDLVAVENDTVVTDPFKGERLNRFVPVFRKYKVPVLYNFRDEDIRWVTYEPKGPMLVLHKIYPKGIKIPDYFVGKNIVHMPTLKCHIYTTTTGAMKNAFGGLLNTKRHYTHSVIHETLVDLLRIQKEIHTGIFAVMDGTTAGDGPGPRTMRPVEVDLLLASGDQVSVDAVAAKVMGFDPMSIRYIRLAHEAGLGVGDPREIEVVGDDISEMNLGFSVGDNMASRVGDLLWFGPLRSIQKLFFHTPLVYIFVLGSFVYHDHIWWPTKGRRYFRRFLSSKWGRLFGSYGLSPRGT